MKYFYDTVENLRESCVVYTYIYIYKGFETSFGFKFLTSSLNKSKKNSQDFLCLHLITYHTRLNEGPSRMLIETSELLLILSFQIELTSSFDVWTFYDHNIPTHCFILLICNSKNLDVIFPRAWLIWNYQCFCVSTFISLNFTCPCPCACLKFWHFRLLLCTNFFSVKIW